MKKKLNSKQGISLIVLVITIIIMIILATAVILSLSSSNIVDKARQAKSSNDIANAKELVEMAYAKWILDETDSFSEYAEQKLVDAGYPESGTGSIEVTENGTVYQYPTIPEGFIASTIKDDPATSEVNEDETTVSGGLVIYALKSEETSIPTTESATTSKTTRNQFVWVPVDDIKKFVRTAGYYNGSLQSLTDYTEPFSKTYNGVTLSLEKDDTGEYAEYNAMVDSVERYGGFYIGRYEAGKTELSTTVLIQKEKTAYNNVSWGPNMVSLSDTGAVELSRSMYPNNSDDTIGVISTLCYGIQWDAVMEWMKDIPNVSYPTKNYIKDSTGMGWYSGTYSTLNPNHNTGVDMINSANKVKNIYDMAGNMLEWTMEAFSSASRVRRGGYYANEGSVNPASIRDGNNPSYTGDNVGFRPSLYIK